MRKNRKTIGVDAEYVELLKQIARNRGMSIASYLRELVENAVKLEDMGYYAPRALLEKQIEILLSRLGFSILPPDILNAKTDEEVVERGVVIGKTIRELGFSPVETIEFIGLSNQLIVSQGENIILLPQYDPVKKKLALLLKGIARGSGLTVIESGETTIILQTSRSLAIYERR